MPIYTRTGDDGTTGLFDGKRISKADKRVETYGSIDELTSFIGLVITKINNKKDQTLLTKIQKELYQIMAFLAGKKEPIIKLENSITLFEQKIDYIQSRLPELKRFILPGGNEKSAWFHILRVVTRKCERNIVCYFNNQSPLEIGNWKLEILKYLNRLSDLFFVIARLYGKNNEKVVK